MSHKRKHRKARRTSAVPNMNKVMSDIMKMTTGLVGMSMVANTGIYAMSSVSKNLHPL